MPVIEKSRVRALTEKLFFQLLEYWSRPWIEWQGMALSFSCNFRPVSLYFDLQKTAKKNLRLILSLYIYKYYLKNLEKSKHEK